MNIYRLTARKAPIVLLVLPGEGKGEKRRVGRLPVVVGRKGMTALELVIPMSPKKGG